MEGHLFAEHPFQSTKHNSHQLRLEKKQANKQTGMQPAVTNLGLTIFHVGLRTRMAPISRPWDEHYGALASTKDDVLFVYL